MVDDTISPLQSYSPPPLPEVLLVIVQSRIVPLTEAMAPPAYSTLLFVRRQCSMVAPVPLPKIPPPWWAKPPVIVKPATTQLDDSLPARVRVELVLPLPSRIVLPTTAGSVGSVERS